MHLVEGVREMKLSPKMLLASVIVVVVAIALVAVYVTSTGNNANANSGTVERFNWIGVVTDGGQRPVGGVTVTLHLMTPAGEACNMTNQTLSDSIYPGSYAFYDVLIPEGVTYAYAVADTGDSGDGVRYVGQTGDLEINRTNIASGLIILRSLTPAGNTTPVNGTATRMLDGWFGSVVDSNGVAMGNVTVTLHLMSPDSEVASYTRQSLSENLYPGTFVFDNITLPDNATYGYATAEALNGTGPVRSSDYALNKSRISSGFLVV
jgi:hypothetical protein